MIRLLLDKSVLKALPQGLLEAHANEFCFVLTGVLLREITTERMPERSGMDAASRGKLDAKIDANLRKIRDGTQNEWYELPAAIRYELETGNSARFGPRAKVSDPLAHCDLDDAHLWEDIDDEESKYVEAMDPAAHQEDLEEKSRRAGPIQDKKDLFRLLDDKRRESHNLTIRYTRTWKDRAIKLGIVTPPRFVVHDSMLCYGMSLASDVLSWWWAWQTKHGQVSPHRTVNTYYDHRQIAYVAIADGLLAKDFDMLHLAWVCWPKKRKHLYTYDDCAREIVPWKPSWES